MAYFRFTAVPGSTTEGTAETPSNSRANHSWMRGRHGQAEGVTTVGNPSSGRSTTVCAAVLGAAFAAALFAPRPACAQLPGYVKTGLGFLHTGGYFFTGNAGGSGGIGSPKFFGEGGYYVRPRKFGNLALTGGLETVNASDHFFPFTGGNDFDLLGPGARLAYYVPGTQIRPYITFGLFAGRVRSVQLDFDRTEFTPSGSVGVEVRLNRDFSVVASYRVTQRIHGVNTDGFGISLKIL
jgi:hypothetical protein